VLDVNLRAAVSTAAIVLPGMIAARQGSLIVLSSLADVLVSSEYPSYNASKAALSSYFEGLGTALRSSGVAVGHIRFGFVDTKMAKARIRPLMVSRQVAAGVVLRALRKRQRRVSFPVRMALLVGLGRAKRYRPCSRVHGLAAPPRVVRVSQSLKIALTVC
jgi:short-subunit dehydrogenase